MKLTYDELAEWWEQASPKHKHFFFTAEQGMGAEGVDRWADRLDDKVLGLVTAKHTICWGCGPGAVTLRLARRGHRVHVVDVAPECLDRARQTLLAEGYPLESATQIMDPKACPDRWPDDLCITSFAVIQHFPSLAYWHEVTDLWNRIAPRQLLIQTKHRDRIVEGGFPRDWVNALCLPTEEVVGRFPDYSLMWHALDVGATKPIWPLGRYEWFLLERK